MAITRTYLIIFAFYDKPGEKYKAVEFKKFRGSTPEEKTTAAEKCIENIASKMKGKYVYMQIVSVIETADWQIDIDTYTYMKL